MKSTHPQGQRFSWRSHRSGRQTRSEVICLTPSRFRPFQNCYASQRCFLFGRERFVSLFFHCSLVADFDVPKETIENGKSFQRTARRRRKVNFLLTRRGSRDISIEYLGIIWNRKKPNCSKARWTCSS